MSDDEPEDEGPEESEEERLEREEQEFADHQLQEHEKWEQERGEIGREEFERAVADGEIKELEEKPENILDSIKNKSTQLADPSLDNDVREKLEAEIQELFDKVSKKPVKVDEEVKYDPEYNAYNFARSAAVLSLESSWIKIRLKIDSLIKKLATTSLEYDKIISLKDTIDTFEKDYIYLIINSVKPKTKNENDPFEAKMFHRIITDFPQLFADFFDVFIGDVTFTPAGTWLPNILKFRIYMLDLRDKKKKDDEHKKSHSPDFTVCDLNNGMNLHKKPDGERGHLYQGYWQVEIMLTELRNHTEHWKKRDSKKFLRQQLGRTLEEPILGSESPGNFFILISILFLVSYHFIDVMQTWVDTDVILKK